MGDFVIGFGAAIILIVICFCIKYALDDMKEGLEREMKYTAVSLKSAPTLTLDDLRPKVRWKKGKDRKIRCSSCKNKALEAREGVWFVPDFCPSCGADMRGEANG